MTLQSFLGRWQFDIDGPAEEAGPGSDLNQAQV